MIFPLWMVLFGSSYVRPQNLDKPPPTIDVDRSWAVPDSTPKGAIVGQVKTIKDNDNEDEDVVFGLEHSYGINIIQSEPNPLPFDIDKETGDVFANQSLINMGGENVLMYVTAKYGDSGLTAKKQIWVKILKPGEKKGSASHPQFPKSPSLMPTFLGSRPPSFDSGHRRAPYYTKVASTNASSEKNSSPVKFTTLSDEGRSKQGPTVPPKNKENSPNATNTKSPEPASALEPSQLTILLIPSIVALSGLCISAILVFLFRKKICRKRHKTKKDFMTKSSCSVLSLEESMVLQNWRGTRTPLSNPYDSWNSDTNPNHGILAPNSKSADKWEIPRHRIKVFSILGEGCFGQVWKCEALNIDNKQGATVVAVKMLKENAGEQERNDLYQELQVMKMLDPHPNVVRLLGCCTDKDPIFVIMEYVPNGTLQSYLRHSRAQRYYNNMHGASNTLTSHDLTSFCYQIANGMHYLSSKGIIHRDLAARNILIGETRTCKVADFGFARDIMTSHVYERKSEGRLPIRWMAPESLYDNIFSVKSDIWSYGVLVWEIVTLGSTPYPGIPASEVMKRVRDGYRLDKPEHCRRELYNIMYYCWAKEPKERPSFAELVDLLEQLLLTETDYIQLENFPDHSYYNMVSLSGEKL